MIEFDSLKKNNFLIWFFSLILSFFWSQWISELRHYAPTVPVVLVGTKLGKINFATFYVFSFQVVLISVGCNGLQIYGTIGNI
jgi:hypothetical protein